MSQIRFKAETNPKNFPSHKIPCSFPRKWNRNFQDSRFILQQIETCVGEIRTNSIDGNNKIIDYSHSDESKTQLIKKIEEKPRKTEALQRDEDEEKLQQTHPWRIKHKPEEEE